MTFSYQNSFYVRAPSVWKILLADIRDTSRYLFFFKSSLFNYYFDLLEHIYNPDNPIRTFKSVCAKCHSTRPLASLYLRCCWQSAKANSHVNVLLEFVWDPVIGDYLCGQSPSVLYIKYVILCNGLVVFMFVFGKYCTINKLPMQCIQETFTFNIFVRTRTNFCIL